MTDLPDLLSYQARGLEKKRNATDCGSGPDEGDMYMLVRVVNRANDTEVIKTHEDNELLGHASSENCA